MLERTHTYIVSMLERAHTYIVSMLERALHAGVHVVMVQRHEHGVHHNAQRDEQVHERIENDERKKLRQPGKIDQIFSGGNICSLNNSLIYFFEGLKNILYSVQEVGTVQQYNRLAN